MNLVSDYKEPLESLLVGSLNEDNYCHIICCMKKNAEEINKWLVFDQIVSCTTLFVTSDTDMTSAPVSPRRSTRKRKLFAESPCVIPMAAHTALSSADFSNVSPSSPAEGLHTAHPSPHGGPHAAHTPTPWRQSRLNFS